MTELLPVPPQMNHLPRSGAIPVPFTTVMIDGVPDFRVSDPDRVLACYTRRLCGVCGKPLPYWISFIGGPLAITNRLFFDPAMHSECARYALAVCPFLAFRNTGFSSRPIPEGSAADPRSSGARPDLFGLYETWSFEPVQLDGAMYVRAAKARAITWFNHTGEIGSGQTPPVNRDVMLLLDGKSAHGAGHACGDCNANGHAYAVRILDVAHVRYETEEDLAMESLDAQHLGRVYGPSEEAALGRARRYSSGQGWRVRE